MYRSVVVFGFALSMAVDVAGPGPCEVLPAAEIAKAMGVPAVKLDSVNTGTNELTKVELCSWLVDPKDPRGVTIKLRRAKAAEETEVLLVAARLDEQVTLDNMQAVPGIGDQAHYADWQDGSGGTLIAKKGATVVTITGTLSKAATLDLGRKAAAKL